MIEAKELMVGNYVDHPKTDDKFCETCMINRYGTEMCLTDNPLGYKFDCSIEDIEPIPLTPEIIKKCGFHSFAFNGYELITKNGHSFRLTTSSKGHFYFEYYSESQLKYLHQLQNLYYVLTSEQLTVKL